MKSFIKVNLDNPGYALSILMNATDKIQESYQNGRVYFVVDGVKTDPAKLKHTIYMKDMSK